MREILQLFQKGKLTEELIITKMITDLGSSLYSYMVMLEGQDRKTEAQRMKDLRDQIFRVRSKFQGIFLTDEEKALDPAVEMQMIEVNLRVIQDMLYVYRPNEATILQVPLNDAIGLCWVLKEYSEKA